MGLLAECPRRKYLASGETQTRGLDANRFQMNPRMGVPDWLRLARACLKSALLTPIPSTTIATPPTFPAQAIARAWHHLHLNETPRLLPLAGFFSPCYLILGGAQQQ